MGIVEKKMETTIVYREYIGIMEKKMATTIVYSQREQLCLRHLRNMLLQQALSAGS